ncbi:MAG: AraC family transcriptional regulator [Calditrichaeota bacterium]|nr:AraC family transcriptional regulator [Calditrichota bacterium]
MVTCVYTIQILYYSYISIRTLNKSSKKVSQLQKLLLFTLMTVLIVDLTALPLTYLISFNYRLYLDIYFVLISALSYLLIGLFIEEPTLFRISQFIENRHQKSNLVLVDIEKKLDELNRIMYSEKMYLNPDLSAGELSARLQISKQQLSELLNKHMKKRFVDYLNQFRLETAVNLLEKSDPSEPIAQIAYQSGFNSIATFYRYFDHHYQCTPTDFRKNILVDRLR